jgi:hypothetical protein
LYRSTIRFLVACVLGFWVGLGTAAVATTTEKDWSFWNYFSTNGIEYRNRSYVETSYGPAVPPTPYGWAKIERTVNINVPINWMGTQAKLYRIPGVLCEASVWSYNEAPAVGIARYVYDSDDSCGPGQQYNSGGRTKSLKADGTYSGHDTYVTLAHYQGFY